MKEPMTKELALERARAHCAAKNVWMTVGIATYFGGRTEWGWAYLEPGHATNFPEGMEFNPQILLAPDGREFSAPGEPVKCEEAKDVWQMAREAMGHERECPRPCSDCDDRKHHWLPACPEDHIEDEQPHPAAILGLTNWFECKHCDAWIPFFNEDEWCDDESETLTEGE